MRQPQYITSLFPIRGLHEGSAKWQQPENTCIDCLNVIPHDVYSGRARGGQRSGLEKYSSAQVSGTNRVQDITHVVYASTATTSDTSVAVRAIKLLAVSNGNVRVMTTTTSSAPTGATALSATTPVIFSAQLFGVVYYVDGAIYRKYTASTDTMATWTSSNGGTLPTNGGNTARLIELWRGRLVLSGVKSDPHNWFMSEQGDALDYNYSPTTPNEQQAVAGNNSPAGLIGDIINGIIPYNDDILIFLGDHTVWQMTGDPASEGRIDNLSDVIGGAWGRAWCRTPDGTIYFLGNRGGIYKLVPDSKPEKITAGPINDRMQRFVGSTFIARMAYNDDEIGIYLWVTDLAGNVVTNYYYDLRQDGWFPHRYGDNNFNPTAVYVFDGDDPSDRKVMVGGKDGYIRYITKQGINDDGTAIQSYVTFGPYQTVTEESPAPFPFVLSEAQVVLTDDSSDVTCNVYVGNSPEDVFSASQSRSGIFLLEPGDELLLETGDSLLLEGSKVDHTATFSKIRSKTINPRLRAYAAYVELGTNSSTSRWSMESLQVKLEAIPTSKRRRL